MLCIWIRFVGYVNVSEVPSQRNDAESGFSQVSMERSGQLYAYRVNSSAVYLGTRNARELGAAIGIKPVASGKYVCIAENSNETDSVNLTVAVISKLWLTLCFYF